MFIDPKILMNQHYIFFPRLKLLMLTYKMTHTAALHLHDILLPSFVAGDKFDDADDVDAAVDCKIVVDRMKFSIQH